MSRTSYGTKVPKLEQPQQTINIRAQPLRKATAAQPPPQQQQQIQQQLYDDAPVYQDVQDEKIPLFLVKLWNIIEDPQYQQIVHWDDSGMSFHIADPYSFCRNVLPHYFKHNNLNSLIRQLNMYGFRKITPISQSGLTRTESDQDHLEFSHPYFVQNHPEYLSNIKRKQSQRAQDDKSAQNQHLDTVMAELRVLRERHKQMESRMTEMTKSNAQMYEQMERLRQQHQKQHIIVSKLVQFMISVMQPSVSKRSLKRTGGSLVAIDDCSSPNKIFRADGSTSSSSTAAQPTHNMLFEILESLKKESNKQGPAAFRRRLIDNGPLIADVTDELDLDGFEEVEGIYAGDHHLSPSNSSPRGTKPPQTFTQTGQKQPQTSQKLQQQQQQSPLAASPEPYIGSGVYTIDMPSKRSTLANPPIKTPVQRYQSRQRQFVQPQQTIKQEPVVTSPTSSTMPSTSPMMSSGPLHHIPMEQHDVFDDIGSNALVSANNGGLIDNGSFSPTIAMSPSLDRQISTEIQDYLNGVDFSIDNCRDLLAGTDWPSAFDNLDLQPNKDSEWIVDNRDHENEIDDTTNQAYSGQQLALEQPRRPELEYYPQGNSQQQQQQPQMGYHDGDLSNDGFEDSFGPFDVNFDPAMSDQVQIDQFPVTPHLQDYISPIPSPNEGDVNQHQ